VYLLTSVLTALLSVSADHVIRMEVCIFPEPPDQNLNVKEIGNPLSVDLKITTGLRDPSEYRNDSGQLSSLAVPGSSAETMLSAASVLAAAAGILPSYYIDYAGQSLQLFLTLRSIESADEHRALPEFRFRDPYRLVTLILEEFFDSLGKM